VLALQQQRDVLLRPASQEEILQRLEQRVGPEGRRLFEGFWAKVKRLEQQNGLCELAIAKRLVLISLFSEFPKVGGLIAYGPNVAEIFRRCGEYVAKILHGAKPSDLPIQRPEKFDLVINLKTATALGVDIPTQLHQLADEVIE
jgi:hypothetical protein